MSLVLMLFGYYTHWSVMLVGAALFVFGFFFFRNPVRKNALTLKDPALILCPADGTIVDIMRDPSDGFALKISIFLSPLDAHVQWMPVAGEITDIIYTPGKFLLAWLPKSSLDNEHNDFVVRTASGNTLIMRQIAGFVARRIVWWVKPGDHVRAGEKCGMIKCGSRVDLFLPATEVFVERGDYVYGGHTILGRLL